MSALGLALALAALSIPASASPLVLVDGQDATALAAPLERSGRRLVNLTALASLAGYVLSTTGQEVLIQSKAGDTWRGAIDSDALVTQDGLRVLSSPIIKENGSLYGPADAATEISGRIVSVESDADVVAAPVQIAAASPQPQRLPQPTLDPSWEGLTIQKTAEELDEYERIFGPGVKTIAARGRKVNLPLAHDSIALQLSQGYVQGADWGTEVQGGGSFAGYRVDFWSQNTMGPKGFELQTGRFTMVSPNGDWSVQAGDMASDIWGWGRGARFAWQGSKWHAPMLSFYQRTERNGEARNVLTVTDYVRLRRWLSVGGEFGADGSYMLRQRLRTKRLTLTPYYREVPNENRSRGVYGSLALWRRASLFAGYSFAENVGFADREWINFGLRIPLPKKVNLTLQQTRTNSATNRSDINAIRVSVPFGRLRVFGRYQQRDLAYASRRPELGWIGTGRHEFFGGATYKAGKRLNISLQTANRWRRDGAVDQWQQLSGSYRFSRNAWLETFSVLPDADTPSQHRVRFTQEINEDWALVLEYGNVSPYQGVEVDIEDERFKVLLRRRFQIPTPATGGDVGGVVSDALGYAVEGVIVRLGNYAALTDKEGRYAFRYVPEGEYSHYVDRASLPADYAVTDGPRTVETHRRSYETSDWTVIPLNSVAGRICIEREPSRECDADSGVEGIAVYLGTRVTATRQGGLFLFHNVLPGRHRVKVGRQTLPDNLAPTTPTESTVEVEAGKSVDFLLFKLQEQRRSIIFQKLDEE